MSASSTNATQNRWQSLHDEAQGHLLIWQKTLLTRIVLPAMVITSLFLVASHWGNSTKNSWSLVLLLTIILSNLYLSSKNRVLKTPWGRIESRSDEMDTIRWSLNFILDTVLFWSLEMHPSSAVIVWTLLSVAAIIEIQKSINQLIVIGLAIISFKVLIFLIYPVDLKTQIYVLSCYLAIIFIFWQMERYLMQEMTAFFTERLRRKSIEKESMTLQREAAIGYSTRAINHEMYNLIGISLLSTDKLRKTYGADNAELARLDTALSYMFKVSGLVLDDLGNQEAPKRMVSLAQLQSDVTLLLGQNIEQNPVRVSIDFPADAEDRYFEERTGATYLIVHNLVKNANEAVQEKYQNEAGGRVTIVARSEQEHIYIEVADNGPGLSPEQIAKFQEMESLASTKSGGHGLGLSFVRRECELNHFALSVSKQKIGIKIKQFL